MSFLLQLANSGVAYTKTPSERRSVLLSNIIGLITFGIGLALFLAYFVWYGWSFVTASIPVIAILALCTLLLNRIGFTTVSRTLLCVIIPLGCLAVSIYAKRLYWEFQDELDYFTFRFLMLSSAVFPAIFFSFREKSRLIGVTLIVFLLLMIFDPAHNYFGVPYQLHNLKATNYSFTNIVILVSFLIIVGAVIFLKKVSEENEEHTLRLVDELNAKNLQLSQKHREIELQHDEISAQTDNLNVSQRKLQEAYELIEAQKEQLLRLNSELSSELVTMNNDLTEANNELIKHNNELRQFSYTVSHNLRGPVASLSGLINLINPRELNEGTNEIFDHIRTSIQRLETVIQDLNQIIDIRNDIFHIRRKVNLAAEVNSILDGLSREIKAHDVIIHTDFTNCESIYSVKPMIHSILYNLISNALKYQAPDRRQEVLIKSTQLNDEVFLEVKDNGLGIDLKNQKQNLFKLYKRFHFHTEGRGLGLYLVKLQTEALGGRIDVDSEVNRFTRFIVTLPVYRDVEQQILYQSKYAKIFFDAKTNSTGVVWSGPISSEQYREVFLKCLEFVKTFNTPNYITDLSNQGYIQREDQMWMFTSILPEAVRYGMKRIAAVRPDTNDPKLKEYFTGIQKHVHQLGIEQRFFTGTEQAIMWLEEASNKNTVSI